MKWETGLTRLFWGTLMFLQGMTVQTWADVSTNPVMVSVGSPPLLKAISATNGQVQLTLFNYPGIPYVIEASSDLLNWSPVVTNTPSDGVSTMALPLSGSGSFFRASRNPIPLFAYALAAENNINLQGPGIASDSWNSHDTNQSNNGLYDSFTGTNGNVACVAGILGLGSHFIYGSVFLGGGASFVSSSSQVSGQIYITNSVFFPDAWLPNVSWLPAPKTSSGSIGYLHDFTNSGSYTVNDSYPIVVEAGITAMIHVTVTSFDCNYLAINGGTTNSGTLIVYQDIGGMTLSGNASGGAIYNRPENFIYIGLPGVTSVTLTTLGTFTGGIYAPEATLTANGGGNAPALLGACVVNSTMVNGHFTFHFDEGLLTHGPFW